MRLVAYVTTATIKRMQPRNRFEGIGY